MSYDKEFPHFIDIKPNREDQFEGQPHNRIAESIFKQLKSKNSALKIIGLEGKWGSGKSTVISILKAKPKKTHYVKIYDVWGHQEDSFRRPFLEELTEELLEDEVIKEIGAINWETKIKDLFTTVRNTHIKKIPYISIGIVLTFILALMTILNSKVVFTDNDPSWIKILPTWAPIILIVVCLIIQLLINIFNGKTKVLYGLFNIFTGERLETSTFEYISERDPSIKDFRTWICDINKALKKPLIIAFDNIDRLSDSKLQAFWALIHTLFAEDSCYISTEECKITVIISFDRSKVQKCFPNDDFEESNQFIKKTFSIVYRIPQPILTDWKKFFRDKFNEAFGESDSERNTILNIFDPLVDKPTPRDMMYFINELVSLKYIWPDIQLKYLALFILKKEEILHNNEKTSTKVIIDENYCKSVKHHFMNQDELANSIAAITFNVTLEKACEILLYSEIELSLRDQNSFDINTLAENSCFIDVLEEIVKKTNIDPATIIKRLNMIKQYEYLSNLKFTSIWDGLASKILDIPISLGGKTKEILKNRTLFCHCSFDMCLKLLENVSRNTGENYRLIEYILQNNLILTRYLIKTSNIWTEIFIEFMKNSIRPLEDKFSNSWILNNGYIFDLTNILFEEHKLNELPLESFNLCEEILFQIFISMDITIDSLSRLKEILKFAFIDNRIKPTIERILNSYMKSDQIIITSEKFVFFEPWFKKYCDIELKSAEYCRKILTPVVENEECLNLIVKDKKYIQVIQKADTDAASFKEKIRTILQKPQVNEELQAFANAIGVSE